MGAAAPANLPDSAPEQQSLPEPQRVPQPSAAAPPAIATLAASGSIDRLRSAVLQALGDGNQHILVSMLDAGEWSVEGNDVVIKVSESQTIIDMSVGPDARRLAIASASGVLGRAVKLKIVPGAALAKPEKRNGTAMLGEPGAAVSGRGRAAQDAVVRRLQEKFGAEIRTVIDYREKR
jgi:DNA polymerase-3 subunit gamma/tau